VVGIPHHEQEPFFESAIASCGDDAFKIKQKTMTADVHGFKMANRLSFRHEV
jgi:hypothetical protein